MSAKTIEIAQRIERGAGWTIHVGDCLEALSLYADDTIDVTIMDPPYEVEAHTKARRALVDSTQKRGARNTGKVRRIDQPLDIAFAAITPEMRANASIEVARLTRRWVLAFCQIEAVAAWRIAFVAAGLDWVRGGVWRKPDGAPQFTGDRPGQGFECVAIAHRPGKKHWNGGGHHAFWEHSLEHGHGGGVRNEHPTQKPMALMLELIEQFTDAGETVLDPFAGSGTTGVAAVRRGRRFIGAECHAPYAELALDRLRAEECGSTLEATRVGQTALFGGEQ